MKETIRSNSSHNTAIRPAGARRPWWKVRRTLLCCLGALCLAAAGIWLVPDVRATLLIEFVSPLDYIARSVAKWDVWPALAFATGIVLFAARFLPRARKQEEDRQVQLHA